ncbi:hypothetical protein [Noviherbaspirillum sp. ST9]|uniref:hypothetical protein n=1 Tax=Noviherbaspirillum sp. ST9 TaxID=3401606 RepID=UPI003B58AE69
MNALYRMRDWLGIPPAFLVLMLLIAIPARHLMSRFPDGRFEVNIEAPAPLPSPSKPELAPPTESVPPAMAAPKALTKRHSRDSASSPAQVLPVPRSTASISSPANEGLQVPELPLPAVPATTPSPVESSTPSLIPTASQTARSLSIDEAYIAQIRTNVQGRKKYPTGREASVQKPSGTVRACMDLGRDGIAANEIVIERTSHSMILDAEARKLLRMGVYPPFPAGAFPGESTHRFCIHLDYTFQPSG